MDRFRLYACVLLSLVLVWPIGLPPARADDVGANKSELVRGVLSTVVNLSTRKDEAKPPEAASTSTSDSDAATPAFYPGQNIRTYGGSGFVIDPSGFIITNYHVVEGAFEITVMFSDGSILPGKLVSASRSADLAIVKVEADHSLAAAQWGDSDALRVGDEVFAAGNPLGVGLSVTSGIVSALNRDIQNSPYDDLIQTDAAINHGNSGGPLFNMQGGVVGVNSAIISPTQGSSGLGFALPSSSARFVYEQLRTYGWVRPAWIGVKIQNVTPEIADGLAMARPEGSIVSWVLPDSPAKKAGLQIGDVILRYDGNAPTDDRALLRDIAHTQVGKTITMLVRRGGNELSVPISPEIWPRDQWEARDAPTPVAKPKIQIPPDLGLSLSALDTEGREKAGLPKDLNGVLIKSVLPWSDPALRGVGNGDVILRVQGKTVALPDDVLSEINTARADKREFVLMLIFPKVRDVPGPKWIALRLSTPVD